uniref:hypothetical protein n=1 Tax=Gracilaria urvillei TaxID=172974 RepID=UPI001D10DDB4|nr:hypothetical protein LK147_mgp01 [Hydropuntia urvillei]UAD89864.1 hypothetical protein [Hydropuntia urvillei]
MTRKFRLIDQYNYIENFDFLDKKILNFLNLKEQKLFKIQNDNSKEFTWLNLNDHLFMEFLTGQRTSFNSKSNIFRTNFSRVTLRKDKIFLFREMILHAIFIKFQFNKTVCKIKISNFALFLSHASFLKLFLTMFGNNFTVFNY